MKHLLIIASLSLLLSCEILTTEPLEVTSYSPSSSHYTDTSSIVVKVSFSNDVNRTLAEGAFSLTTNGVEVPGTFIWINSKTMQYNLYHNLEMGNDYVLKVSADAEDVDGNSLSHDFVHNFSTKQTDGRPLITSLSPTNFSIIDDEYKTIDITFSKPMNPESVVDNFSITPPVPGHFQWDSTKTVFNFIPGEPYKWQTDYSITLGAETKDNDGWTTGYELISKFNTGIDKDAPTIISVTDPGKVFFIAEDDPLDDTFTITQDWVHNQNIAIQFSEAMDRTSVESGISIEPACAFDKSWSTSFQGDILTITWKEHLTYNLSYNLRISESAKDSYGNPFTRPVDYHFIVNSSKSRPPELLRLAYINNTDEIFLYNKEFPADETKNLTAFDFSNSTGATVAFDFHILIADDSYIDQFSFMDNYAILPQGNALTFTPENLITRTSTTVGPVNYSPGGVALPAPTGNTPDGVYPKVLVVRIIGTLDDLANAVGNIDFKMYKDYVDSKGLKLQEDWHWQVFDNDP